MDIGFGVLIGGAYKWAFNWLKSVMHWSDKGAAWAFLGGGLLIAFFYNLFTGGFAGLTFDPSNFGQSITAVGAAWGIISGTASAWFAVSKKSKK